MQYDDGCETFHSDDFAVETFAMMEGWYWWSCQPGCIPDSEPYGPFETEQEARDSYLYD